MTEENNGRAKIREVYTLVGDLRDDLSDKIGSVNTTLAILVTKIDAFQKNCEKIQGKNEKRVIYEDGQFTSIGRIKVKFYGIAASISVFSIVIGALIGRYLLI